MIWSGSYVLSLDSQFTKTLYLEPLYDLSPENNGISYGVIDLKCHSLFSISSLSIWLMLSLYVTISSNSLSLTEHLNLMKLTSLAQSLSFSLIASMIRSLNLVPSSWNCCKNVRPTRPQGSRVGLMHHFLYPHHVWTELFHHVDYLCLG